MTRITCATCVYFAPATDEIIPTGGGTCTNDASPIGRVGASWVCGWYDELTAPSIGFTCEACGAEPVKYDFGICPKCVAKEESAPKVEVGE